MVFMVTKIKAYMSCIVEINTIIKVRMPEGTCTYINQ